MDIMSTIQSSMEIAGKLRELSKKIQDAEFSMLLADLSCNLADAKLEVAELKQQIATLKEQNLKQAEQLANRQAAKPKLSDSCYAFDEEEGLFCTNCWDTKEQKVRVTALPRDFRAFGKWRCPSCTAKYG